MKRSGISIFLLVLLVFSVYACKPKSELISTPGTVFELNDTEIAYIVTGYTGDSKDIVISSIHNDLPVISIADEAFLNLDNIESVALPDTITSIGKDAFIGTNIKYFTVPVNLKYFGQALEINEVQVVLKENHNYLKQMEISGHKTIVTKDEKELLYVEIAKEADSIFVLPDNFEYIGPRAMSKTDFKEIFLPESLIEIKYAAFSFNSDTIIHLPSYLEVIGVAAFVKCRFTGNLVLPEGLSEVGALAFYENALTSVVFPSTIEKIGRYVFDNSNNAFPNYNDIHTLTFNSYILQGDAHEQFSSYFIFDNYRDTLIDTLTIYLPENEEQASRLRQAILDSMEFAEDHISKEIEIIFIP
ncbi:leucine-rich repeat domain-containing protein [Peloplasma aerotolerans]|uniref:Leucine-rich repeat protein n=1 Tax=Peloplasma aerotolerans TaxID=3044389 RepID=A0AAW6UAC8_9MOLU|nr:leucine-rich repeat domain-containing protein [Mariniplasma sp. M4Ah]MDI6452884.1 leucine-rich repeat protein [Mariniplasma sp. M4Ah]MDR4968540.1 leucine-rich repeat protein [Acholeplasmataceae bacterium]